MRVLLVGEGHPHRLAMSYCRGFRQVGAEVAVFDYYSRIALKTRHPGVNMLPAPVLRPAAAAALVLKAATYRPDLVLFLKVDDLPLPTYAALRRVLRPGATLAAFHPDDPENIRTLLRRGPSNRRALKQARTVDRYFLWSNSLIERLARKGIRADYLAFACDPEIFQPATEKSSDARRLAGRFDVAFVGNWDERREHWLKPLAESGLRVGIWGMRYWQTRCRTEALRRAWQGEEASPDLFASICRSVPVSLNLLREQNVGAHNMRTFEIPACAGLMLAEYSADQAQHFREGEEAYYARTPEDLVKGCRSILLQAPAVLDAVRARAYKKAMSETYADRARFLCTALGVR